MPRVDDKTLQQRIESVWFTVCRHPNGLSEMEIARKTGYHRRTVNNYLSQLSDEGKIYKDGSLWYGLHYDKMQLRSLDLSVEEAYTLYLASRLFVKQHDKRNEPAESALRKLAHVLEADAGIGNEIAQAADELAQHPKDGVYQSVFATMVRGFIYRRRVAIRYCPLNGTPFETKFDTYLLEPSSFGHATYAVGRSSAPDALRAYKLSRIEKATLLREEYRIPKQFPGLSILEDSWSIMIGDEPTEVVLRFSPAVRQRVVETQWHASQQLCNDPERDGYLRMTLHVSQTRDMLPWIRGWGAQVEVLEPHELREELMAEARRMGELYGWRFATGGADDGLSEEVDFFGGELARRGELNLKSH